MPEGTVSWKHWPLDSQAVIDECAEALYVAGFDNDVRRGHTPQNAESRFITIHLPDTPGPLTANLGDVVVLLFGKPQVLSPELYAETFPGSVT